MPEVTRVQTQTLTPQPVTQPTKQPETQDSQKINITPTDVKDLSIRFGKVPSRAVRLPEIIKHRSDDEGDVDQYDNVVVHYSHTRAHNNSGKSANLHGIAGGWGTLIWEPTNYMKVSAEGLLDTGFSKEGWSIGAGVALKNFVGLDFNILGVSLPIGAYVKAGPQLNYTRLQGDGSFGVGVAASAGVTIFGLDAEMTRTLATNRDDYGFRLGATVKF